ncbi:MAG: hypothetical protein EOR63_32140 [Mesorhizobium sp.]|nr:MAG: hypothetical protein EOR63_32140 [Mesorhizobium sp.]
MSEQDESMTAAMDRTVGDWLPEGAEILWQSEKLFDGGAFLQKHVLAVDPDDGSVTVIRGWMSGPQGTPAVSVDLSVPYEAFAGDIDSDTFPHSPERGQAALSSRPDPLEMAFRAELLGEQVEVLWESKPDHSYAAFIARSAKVNRSEHVVAGVVSVENGVTTVDIGFRQELAALKPAVTPTTPR